MRQEQPPEHPEPVPPENVDELTADMRGRWVVTTKGSKHIWDLDAMTYTRLPGPDSTAGSMLHDNIAHRITRVDRWPRVGSYSLVWFDDPDWPQAPFEHWRKSSTIRSIEPIDHPQAVADVHTHPTDPPPEQQPS